MQISVDFWLFPPFPRPRSRLNLDRFRFGLAILNRFSVILLHCDSVLLAVEILVILAHDSGNRAIHDSRFYATKVLSMRQMVATANRYFPLHPVGMVPTVVDSVLYHPASFTLCPEAPWDMQAISKCLAAKILKDRSLQCGFWPQGSQIPIWILLWILGGFFPPAFPRRRPEKIHKKIPRKIQLGTRSEKLPSDFCRSPFLKKIPSSKSLHTSKIYNSHVVHCASRNYTCKVYFFFVMDGAGHYMILHQINIVGRQIFFGVITLNLCNEVPAIT